MRLPTQTVMLRVDYGEPDWRESDAELGYAELTHDGAHLWIKIDGKYEIEMHPKGARIVAEALTAFADMLEPRP